jgi:hypothetical protein
MDENSRRATWQSRCMMLIEAAIRVGVPAVICLLFIVTSIHDYDRYFPNPPDHFSPARAISAIVILVAMLIWLAWRFSKFIRRTKNS